MFRTLQPPDQRRPKRSYSLGITNDNDQPILREEVEAAIRAFKSGKAAGTYNIPAELIKHGGETVNDMLTKICFEI